MVSDLIDRQAAMVVFENSGLDDDSKDTAMRLLEQLPPAQPEIIRCKDCKHYYFAGNRVPEEQSWVCDVWHVNQTAHMGYCFKAERRSDE